MKVVSIAVTAMAVAMALGGPALAQPYAYDQYSQGHYSGQGHYRGQRVHRGWSDHSDWRRGGRVARHDWDRGHRVDYRSHHLRRPSRGYEWREVDGNYVMAAVATGMIASMIMSGHH